MKPETAVISVLGKYNIYVEQYKRDTAAKTIIMVNGAFATTNSFNQTIRFFKDKLNIVLFDLPYAGRSKEHNLSEEVITKEDEVEILLALIDHFQVNYVYSASWGGVSALLSLARRPRTVEKAVVASFSPIINDAMRDYMEGIRESLEAGDLDRGARLLNDTVGHYLPNMLKARNFDYLIASAKGNEEQLVFHINQVYKLDQQQYMTRFSSIDIPVLFLNGEMDAYTTTQEVQLLADCMPRSEFRAVKGAGHFLDLEGRQVWRMMNELLADWVFTEELRYPVNPSYNLSLDDSLAYAEAGD